MSVPFQTSSSSDLIEAYVESPAGSQYDAIVQELDRGIHDRCDRVATVVEHLPLKQRVPGSTPGPGGTRSTQDFTAEYPTNLYATYSQKQIYI